MISSEDTKKFTVSSFKSDSFEIISFKLFFISSIKDFKKTEFTLLSLKIFFK